MSSLFKQIPVIKLNYMTLNHNSFIVKCLKTIVLYLLNYLTMTNGPQDLIS